MKIKMFEFFVSILVMIILMVLHEFPKTLCYCLMSKKDGVKKLKTDVFFVHNYIDPIGLILGVVAYAGFSKPYMYRIQNPRKNLILGWLGIFILIGFFTLSIFVLRSNPLAENAVLSRENWKKLFIYIFWFYMAILSGGMLLVNLFPISVFDMGLLIAGCSPKHYLGIIKNDIFIKLILLFAMTIGLIRKLVIWMITFLLALK